MGSGSTAPVSGADGERLTQAVHGAADVDAVARAALTHLATLPEVSRVGLALVEGAGRRLRFVASDELDVDRLEWCHIDAYDDVPLTHVTRTGAPVAGSLDDLADRYADVVAHQREQGTCALAAVPLPGPTGPMGGLIVFYDADQRFDEEQLGGLEAAARRLAEAVRRVSAVAGGPRPAGPDEAQPDERTSDDARRARLRIGHDARAAGEARRFLRERLELWGVDQATSDTAQLCLSELVNNVIMHARADAELTIRLEDGVLRVVLRDHGGNRAGQRPPAPVPDDDPLRVFGRGLTLVDAFVDAWGTDRDEVGTTAWFTLTPAP